MSAAHKLLDRLEILGLVDDSVLAELRRKAGDAKAPLSADAAAKQLIEQGFLTAFQAKKLLADVGESGESKPAAAKPVKPAQDEDLGLALMEDEPAPEKPIPAKSAVDKAAAEKAAAEKAAADKAAADKAAADKAAAAKAAAAKAGAVAG